jgi:signal transduction histidine kinase
MIMSKLNDTPSEDYKKFEDFVNMAVHELKTPVTVLKAYLQLIMAQLRRENQHNYIKTAEKMDVQLHKLLHLIDDLHDGVKANSDEIHCLMNDFNISESIRMCCENAKAMYPDFNIELEIEECDPIIRGDKDRIEQVLNNFINNAIKYSVDNKCIHVKCRRLDGQFVVTVFDHGIGIPEEKQDRVFQQFYRVESATERKRPGLGLGLFICAEIIKKHNGKIGVCSKEKEGSEFWFSVPVK